MLNSLTTTALFLAATFAPTPTPPETEEVKHLRYNIVTLQESVRFAQDRAAAAEGANAILQMQLRNAKGAEADRSARAVRQAAGAAGSAAVTAAEAKDAANEVLDQVSGLVEAARQLQTAKEQTVDAAEKAVQAAEKVRMSGSQPPWLTLALAVIGTFGGIKLHGKLKENSAIAHTLTDTTTSLARVIETSGGVQAEELRKELRNTKDALLTLMLQQEKEAKARRKT